MYRSLKFRNLIVIDKAQGGKSDAVNAGLNVATNPLVAIVDGDSVLESESLMRVMQLFLKEPDDLAAVGGTVRVLNGCEIENGRVSKIGLSKNPLALFQTLEYLRAFLLARLAWSEMGALTLISGAFGVFRKDILVEIGGYCSNTVGEDFEVIMKIHEHAGKSGKSLKVRFIPEPVCWTRVPTNLKQLSDQRARWQRGALETYFKYRGMLGQSKFGTVGSLGMGNMMLTDVIGPILEVLGYILVPLFWALGWLSVEFALAFLAIMLFFGIFISVSSLVLEEIELKKYPKGRQVFVLGMAAILENFGYRQLNNLFRCRGYWQYLRGSKAW
jgi:cellulose synthase/poly-beta-1,6-N-acetylglucosamine synthase-like glycosyltransferase